MALDQLIMLGWITTEEELLCLKTVAFYNGEINSETPKKSGAEIFQTMFQEEFEENIL